jgi:hypothetical protein
MPTEGMVFCILVESDTQTSIHSFALNIGTKIRFEHVAFQSILPAAAPCISDSHLFDRHTKDAARRLDLALATGSPTRVEKLLTSAITHRGTTQSIVEGLQPQV